MNNILKFADYNRAIVRSGMVDLTNRQMAIALLVTQPGGRQTCSKVARALNIQKPVVNRAINTLTKLGIVKRMPCDDDGRVCFYVAGPAANDWLTTLDAVIAA